VADLIERAGQKGPFVLAIDAPYGSGKSTFIAMLRAVLAARDFYSVQFNAWQVDNTADPLIPMVATLDDAMRTELVVESRLSASLDTVRRVTTVVAKRGAVAAAKAATLGVLHLDKEYEAVASALAGDLANDAVEQFQKDQEFSKRFRTELAKAVEELPNSNKKPTLVFFVDELDRCRPDFAISLLERIKHMFDVDNVVFVLSIDKPQLEAVTAAIYGSQINASEYLRKFIDIEFGLPRPSSKQFVEESIKKLEIDKMFAARGHNAVLEQAHFVQFFSAISDALELSLRTQERCLTRAKIVLEQTSNNHTFNPVLVAVLVVLRSINEPLFSRLVQQRIDFAEILKLFHAENDERLRKEDRVVIEATLVAEIADETTRDRWVNKYNAILDTTNSPAEQKDYANRFVKILRGLAGRMDMPGTVLSIVARRVDMAASIRD
jgi:hypothetical protein